MSSKDSPKTSDGVPALRSIEPESTTSGVRAVGDVVVRAGECRRVQRCVDVSRRRGTPGYGHVHGLMKPSGFLPIARRASLMLVIIAPTTGLDADVPNTSSNSPSTATT
jgi:hypothetical protein